MTKDLFYIGCYTTPDSGGEGQAEGLYVFQLDTESGQLQRIQAVDAGPNPSFLAAIPGGKYVFAVNEQAEGQVSALGSGMDGKLALINHQPVLGESPCYISFDPSWRWVFTACYGSGNFTVLPVDQNRRLQPIAAVVMHEGTGHDPDRQDKAHAHSIRFSPDKEFVFGVDLGLDRVWIFRFDNQTGELSPHVPPAFESEPGAGPRHLEYSADGRFVYVANELNSTVTVCAWDAETGRLEALQSLSTLNADFRGENTVADIHISPSGEVLYVSNRGENSLAAFQIDLTSGRLERIGSYPCGGDSPRNFAIHPQGKFMLVANQKSGNVVVFEIAPDGALIPTGEEAHLTAPVCVIFAS